MRFLLFGTGNYYERYKKWFLKKDIVALLDNSPHKQNTVIDGIEVLAPENGVKRPFDVVVILSFYVKEMRQQLQELGVSEKKIFHFYDLNQLLYRRELERPVQYYECESTFSDFRHAYRNKILLLSQDLDLGGPALALFQAARVLKQQSFYVIYASMIDGPLKSRLLQEQIPVVVDVNMQIATMEDCGWIKGFDLIICNTINFHVFLTKRDCRMPVIWWLHDSAFFYHGVRKDVLQAIDREQLTVCSVGPVPEQAIHEFVPDLPVQRLLYGVEDCFCEAKAAGEKICFITIGYIEYRKGQDVLVEAIRLLPKEIREKTRFDFVGQKTSMLAQKLLEQTETMPEITMTGSVDRMQINEMLQNADLMICPSREDPMPTVCAEAMMHGVPCLVSDTVGMAEYIENEVNGLVFQNENAKMLSEKIQWCVYHHDKLSNMGMCAREVYHKYFSMDVFERELLALVDKCIAT